MTTALEIDASLYRDALSIQEAHALTGLSTRTIRHAIQSGELTALRPPGTRAWRIPRTEFRRWLKAGECTPPTTDQAGA